MPVKAVPCLCVDDGCKTAGRTWMRMDCTTVLLHQSALLLYHRRNNSREISMRQQKTVTDEQLEKAHGIMARIVRDYGDQYLPIFKRLHEEKAARQANSDLKNIALQVAQCANR